MSIPFTSLDTFSLPSSSAINDASCCPTADLLAILNDETVSLWRMVCDAGASRRVWDAKVNMPSSYTGKGKGRERSAKHAKMAWSPDGKYLAIVGPASSHVSLLSVDNGKAVHEFQMALRPDEEVSCIHWQDSSVLKHVDSSKQPGSAQFILQSLPKLKSQEKQTKILTSIFNTVIESKELKVPSHLQQMPFIIRPPSASSICGDVSAYSSVHTVLSIGTSKSRAFHYLGGTYIVGVTESGNGAGDNIVIDIGVSPEGNEIVMISGRRTDGLSGFSTTDNLAISSVQQDRLAVPASDQVRSVAELVDGSSCLRSLLIYIHNSLTSMRDIWIGPDGPSTAGSSWMQKLKDKGEESALNPPPPILDLTHLLLLGSGSKPLAAFLTSCLTERNIASWENKTMSALRSLQEELDEAFVPALERVILLLEDLAGNLAWPNSFAQINLPLPTIMECMMSAKALIRLSWKLRKCVLNEIDQFEQFIAWIKFEHQRQLHLELQNTVVAHTRIDFTTKGSHDVAAVYNYISGGLISSEIDGYFSEPASFPQSPEIGLGRQLSKVTNLDSVIADSASFLSSEINVFLEPKTSVITRLPIPRTRVSLSGQATSVISTSRRKQRRAEEVNSYSGLKANSLIIVCEELIRKTSTACTDASLGVFGGARQSELLPEVFPGQTPMSTKFKLTFNNAKGTMLSLGQIKDFEGNDLVHIVKIEWTIAQKDVQYQQATIQMLGHVKDSEWCIFDNERLLFLSQIGPESRDALISVPYTEINYLEIGKPNCFNVDLSRSREMFELEPANLSCNGRKSRRMACIMSRDGRRIEVFDVDEDEEGTEGC